MKLNGIEQRWTRVIQILDGDKVLNGRRLLLRWRPSGWACLDEDGRVS
jgi:hypothetical protein